MAGGAGTTTTNPASVADRLLTYFSKKLLEIQVDQLRLVDFGMKAALPQKASSKTIRFFKFSPASSGLYASATEDASTEAKSTVQALTEGTAISAFRANPTTKVDATLVQYGEATKISDIMTLIDAYEPLKQNIDLMGRDAALHADTLIRNSLVGTGSLTATAGTNTGSDRFAGTAWATSGTATFDTFTAATVAASKLTRAAVLACVTQLKRNKAPRMANGRYVGVVPPEGVHDLLQDASYLAAFQYSDVQKLYKGMLGTLDGIDFVEATNPFKEATTTTTYGTYNATAGAGAGGTIYSAQFLGMNAFGIPELAGAKGPWAPQIIINDKPDKVDPLNQYITAGWKAFYTAIGLDVLNAVNLRFKTTFA